MSDDVTRWSTARDTLVRLWGRARVLLVRGIPEISPQAAGLFRIVMMALILQFVYRQLMPRPDLAVPPEAHRELAFYLDFDVVHELCSRPEVFAPIYDVTRWLLVLVMVGLFTRLAHALACAGIFCLLAYHLTRSGMHDWGAPFLGLVALIPARWGDALSVDALVRRLRGRPPPCAPGRVYGYAVWAPGFVIGVALAAAAFAKLATSGPAWITTGALKYHLLEDVSSAIIPAGPWLAAHPYVAILASFAAVALEGLWILHAFFGRTWVRLLALVSAIGLLIGFYLFMGLWWRPWWLMLLGLLPWEGFYRAATFWRRGPDADDAAAPRPATARLITTAQMAVIVYVLCQQGIVSLLRTEAEPLFSNYPMYSNTHASLEAFYDDKRWYKYQAYYFVATTGAGAPVEATAAVQAVPQALPYAFIEYVAQRYRGHDEAAQSNLERVGEFHRALSKVVGNDVRTLIVVADQLAVDGPGGRRFWRRRGLPLAEVELSTGRIVTDRPADLEPVVAEALGADSPPMLFVKGTPEPRPAGRLYQAPLAIGVGAGSRPVPDELAARIRRLLRRAPDGESVGAAPEAGGTLHVGPEVYRLLPGAVTRTDEDGLVLTWSDVVLDELQAIAER